MESTTTEISPPEADEAVKGSALSATTEPGSPSTPVDPDIEKPLLPPVPESLEQPSPTSTEGTESFPSLPPLPEVFEPPTLVSADTPAEENTGVPLQKPETPPPPTETKVEEQPVVTPPDEPREESSKPTVTPEDKKYSYICVRVDINNDGNPIPVTAEQELFKVNSQFDLKTIVKTLSCRLKEDYENDEQDNECVETKNGTPKTETEQQPPEKKTAKQTKSATTAAERKKYIMERASMMRTLLLGPFEDQTPGVETIQPDNESLMRRASSLGPLLDLYKIGDFLKNRYDIDDEDTIPGEHISLLQLLYQVESCNDKATRKRKSLIDDLVSAVSRASSGDTSSSTEENGDPYVRFRRIYETLLRVMDGFLYPFKFNYTFSLVTRTSNNLRSIREIYDRAESTTYYNTNLFSSLGRGTGVLSSSAIPRIMQLVFVHTVTWCSEYFYAFISSKDVNLFPRRFYNPFLTSSTKSLIDVYINQIRSEWLDTFLATCDGSEKVIQSADKILTLKGIGVDRKKFDDEGWRQSLLQYAKEGGGVPEENNPSGFKHTLFTFLTSLLLNPFSSSSSSVSQQQRKVIDSFTRGGMSSEEMNIYAGLFEVFNLWMKHMIERWFLPDGFLYRYMLKMMIEYPAYILENKQQIHQDRLARQQETYQTSISFPFSDPNSMAKASSSYSIPVSASDGDSIEQASFIMDILEETVAEHFKRMREVTMLSPPVKKNGNFNSPFDTFFSEWGQDVIRSIVADLKVVQASRAFLCKWHCGGKIIGDICTWDELKEYLVSSGEQSESGKDDEREVTPFPHEGSSSTSISYGMESITPKKRSSTKTDKRKRQHKKSIALKFLSALRGSGNPGSTSVASPLVDPLHQQVSSETQPVGLGLSISVSTSRLPNQNNLLSMLGFAFASSSGQDAEDSLVSEAELENDAYFLPVSINDDVRMFFMCQPMGITLSGFIRQIAVAIEEIVISADFTSHVSTIVDDDYYVSESMGRSSSQGRQIGPSYVVPGRKFSSSSTTKWYEEMQEMKRRKSQQKRMSTAKSFGKSGSGGMTRIYPENTKLTAETSYVLKKLVDKMIQYHQSVKGYKENTSFISNKMSHYFPYAVANGFFLYMPSHSYTSTVVGDTDLLMAQQRFSKQLELLGVGKLYNRHVLEYVKSWLDYKKKQSESGVTERSSSMTKVRRTKTANVIGFPEYSNDPRIKSLIDSVEAEQDFERYLVAEESISTGTMKRLKDAVTREAQMYQKLSYMNVDKSVVEYRKVQVRYFCQLYQTHICFFSQENILEVPFESPKLEKEEGRKEELKQQEQQSTYIKSGNTISPVSSIVSFYFPQWVEACQKAKHISLKLVQDVAAIQMIQHVFSGEEEDAIQQSTRFRQSKEDLEVLQKILNKYKHIFKYNNLVRTKDRYVESKIILKRELRLSTDSIDKRIAEIETELLEYTRNPSLQKGVVHQQKEGEEGETSTGKQEGEEIANWPKWASVVEKEIACFFEKCPRTFPDTFSKLGQVGADNAVAVCNKIKHKVQQRLVSEESGSMLRRIVKLYEKVLNEFVSCLIKVVHDIYETSDPSAYDDGECFGNESEEDGETLEEKLSTLKSPAKRVIACYSVLKNHVYDGYFHCVKNGIEKVLDILQNSALFSGKEAATAIDDLYEKRVKLREKALALIRIQESCLLSSEPSAPQQYIYRDTNADAAEPFGPSSVIVQLCHAMRFVVFIIDSIPVFGCPVIQEDSSPPYGNGKSITYKQVAASDTINRILTNPYVYSPLSLLSTGSQGETTGKPTAEEQQQFVETEDSLFRCILPVPFQLPQMKTPERVSFRGETGMSTSLPLGGESLRQTLERKREYEKSVYRGSLYVDLDQVKDMLLLAFNTTQHISERQRRTESSGQEKQQPVLSEDLPEDLKRQLQELYTFCSGFTVMPSYHIPKLITYQILRERASKYQSEREGNSGVGKWQDILTLENCRQLTKEEKDIQAIEEKQGHVRDYFLKSARQAKQALRHASSSELYRRVIESSLTELIPDSSTVKTVLENLDLDNLQPPPLVDLITEFVVKNVLTIGKDPQMVYNENCACLEDQFMMVRQSIEEALHDIQTIYIDAVIPIFSGLSRLFFEIIKSYPKWGILVDPLEKLVEESNSSEDQSTMYESNKNRVHESLLAFTKTKLTFVSSIFHVLCTSRWLTMFFPFRVFGNSAGPTSTSGNVSPLLDGEFSFQRPPSISPEEWCSSSGWRIVSRLFDTTVTIAEKRQAVASVTREAFQSVLLAITGSPEVCQIAKDQLDLDGWTNILENYRWCYDVRDIVNEWESGVPFAQRRIVHKNPSWFTSIKGFFPSVVTTAHYVQEANSFLWSCLFDGVQDRIGFLLYPIVKTLYAVTHTPSQIVFYPYPVDQFLKNIPHLLSKLINFIATVRHDAPSKKRVQYLCNWGVYLAALRNASMTCKNEIRQHEILFDYIKSLYVVSSYHIGVSRVNNRFQYDKDILKKQWNVDDFLSSHLPI